MRADPDQVAQLRDRARVDAGLEARYLQAKPAKTSKPAPQKPEKPTVEQERAERLANGLQGGEGWHLETAESAFTPGFRFQYVVLEHISPPWEGLDEMLITRGLLSRADVRPAAVQREEEAAF